MRTMNNWKVCSGINLLRPTSQSDCHGQATPFEGKARSCRLRWQWSKIVCAGVSYLKIFGSIWTPGSSKEVFRSQNWARALWVTPEVGVFKRHKTILLSNQFSKNNLLDTKVKLLLLVQGFLKLEVGQMSAVSLPKTAWTTLTMIMIIKMMTISEWICLKIASTLIFCSALQDIFRVSNSQATATMASMAR